MIRFLDDVAKFDQVVCDNVLWSFDDAEEIGSSDINACVNSIFRDLGFDPKEVSNDEFRVMKFAVRNAIGNLDDIRANY
jgi:hypothetical protein